MGRRGFEQRTSLTPAPLPKGEGRQAKGKRETVEKQIKIEIEIKQTLQAKKEGRSLMARPSSLNFST
ncbi:hypothetical protein [Citrifermentans bemidjiense]|uniref:hypothetical protein n=1 Tax=Citrifermentans bemidjiense TaxID=225194 RepID=UPI00059CB7CE|nr:hypothetical protein [Citrifermentans bemidjiense]